MNVIKNKELIYGLINEDVMENLNVIGRIANNPSVEIYVDSIDNPKGFIVKDDYFLAPYSKDDRVIKKMLDNYPMPKELGFCGIPARVAKLVEEHLTGYVLEWEEDCHLLYLPKEKWPSYRGGQTLASLTVEDVEIVNHYYTYKDDTSREYLLECIRNRPSSVIRDQQGKPMSWALVREDYSMGVMYTVTDHRNKGLGEKITADLTNKVIQLGYTPYVHIRFGNIPSVNLAIKSGFINWGHVRWFGLKRR